MTNVMAVWLFVAHYGHSAVIEFIVEVGDQIVTHYFLVLVLKLGVIHVSYVAYKRVRKKK